MHSSESPSDITVHSKQQAAGSAYQTFFFALSFASQATYRLLFYFLSHYYYYRYHDHQIFQNLSFFLVHVFVYFCFCGYYIKPEILLLHKYIMNVFICSLLTMARTIAGTCTISGYHTVFIQLK